MSRDAEADALLDSCARQGIASVPFFPLGGAGAPDIEGLQRVADRHGATPALRPDAEDLADLTSH